MVASKRKPPYDTLFDGDSPLACEWVAKARTNINRMAVHNEGIPANLSNSDLTDAELVTIRSNEAIKAFMKDKTETKVLLKEANALSGKEQKHMPYQFMLFESHFADSGQVMRRTQNFFKLIPMMRGLVAMIENSDVLKKIISTLNLKKYTFITDTNAWGYKNKNVAAHLSMVVLILCFYIYGTESTEINKIQNKTKTKCWGNSFKYMKMSLNYIEWYYQEYRKSKTKTDHNEEEDGEGNKTE